MQLPGMKELFLYATYSLMAVSKQLLNSAINLVTQILFPGCSLFIVILTNLNRLLGKHLPT